MQPEPCTRRREYMCMCIYGVRHVQTEWCTFRAEVYVHILAQCLACAVRALYLLCIVCAVYPLHASGVERVPCAPYVYVYRFGMDRLSDARIVHECVRACVHPVCERVQC